MTLAVFALVHARGIPAGSTETARVSSLVREDPRDKFSMSDSVKITGPSSDCAKVPGHPLGRGRSFSERSRDSTVSGGGGFLGRPLLAPPHEAQNRCSARLMSDYSLQFRRLTRSELRELYAERLNRAESR